MKKIILSDKEYEYLTKGIVGGICLGIIIGLIIGDVIFFFSLGGIIGIVSAIIFSVVKRFKMDIE